MHGPYFHRRAAVGTAEDDINTLRGGDGSRQWWTFATPQQIDFEQMHLGTQDVTPLPLVSRLGLMTGALVDRRENFNDSDQLL